MASLADYELGPVLAKGGMGVVHEAVERASGRRVAVKRILPHVLDRAAVARFLVEGRAVTRLSHPGIVAVHALGEADGAPFLVMELVTGESLQRRLERGGALPVELACRLTFELAAALAHAHARGVLHRDLKPANALVDASGAVKLIDFGLAKLAAGAGSLDHLTRTGELVGTPAFMAPEQANGGTCDARTDVYGLGATLHALLTGEAPFAGTNALALLQQVLEQPARAPSRRRTGIPPALDALVLACLAKEPAARPASMEVVAARLTGPGAPARAAGRGVVPALSVLALVAIAAGAAALAGRPRRSGEGAGPAVPAGGVAPVTTPVDPAPPPAQVAAPSSRVRVGAWELGAWPQEALDRAQDEAVEVALRPPPPGAPREAWLTHVRRLMSARRFAAARAALARPPLDGPERDLILLRFEAVMGLRPPPGSLDRSALDRELALDPGWTPALYARAMGQLATLPERGPIGRAIAQLREVGARGLAACLQAELALVDDDTSKDEQPMVERALELLAVEGERGVQERMLAGLLRSRLRAEGSVAEVLGSAEEDLSAALETDPLLARALSERAYVRQRRGELPGCLDDLRRLAALADDPEVRTAVLARSARVLLARQPARTLAALPPTPTDDGETESLRGEALKTLGRTDEARAAFARPLDAQLPGPPILYLSCAAEVGPQASARCVERFVGLLRRDAAEDWPVWFTSLCLYWKLQMQADVEAALAAELERRPDASGLRRVRVYLRSHHGQHARALPDCDLLLRKAPGSPWDLLLRGTIRFRAGDLEGADSDYRAAAERAGAARAEEASFPLVSLHEAAFRAPRNPGLQTLVDLLERYLSGGPR